MLFVCFRWSTRRSTRRAKVGVCWSLEIHRPTEFLKKLRRSRVRWGTRFNRELSPAGSEITTHHHSFLCLSVFPSLSFSMNIAENMRRTWKEKPWWTWTRRQDTWQHDMLAVCWTRFHIHTDTHIHTRACLHRSLFVSLQKEYRKDLEQEVKGRGLSGIGLEETPELLRIKNANQILNQVRVDFVFLLKKLVLGCDCDSSIPPVVRGSIAGICRQKSWAKAWSWALTSWIFNEPREPQRSRVRYGRKENIGNKAAKLHLVNSDVPQNKP